MREFENEPLLELRRAPVRERLLAARDRLRGRLPIEVPVIVGGERRGGADLESVDPADPAVIVARAAVADDADADAAVRVAADAQPAWGAVSARERAGCLMEAAHTMRADRVDLAALVVREAGKPWVDADAEVCEAIDFLEYYARSAVRFETGPALIQPPGERNELRYAARGVVAVIAPWNFPLAISTGMVAAGLAAGNAVVYKPAAETPACGLAVVEALHAGGVPPDALSLLPGGDRPGVALVAHPGVHTIAFTGSCQAGIEISRAAAKPAAGQRHLKRVVAEMGGKNCVIVDSDADLDEVVPAVVGSAFGFAGQKCSAASRLLVHEAIADALATRLDGAVRALRIGAPDELGVDLGPVIDDASVQRFERYVALGAEQGAIRASTPGVPEGGYFCAPTVVEGLPPGSELIRDEVFAPLLTFERVADVDAACDLVEESSFALTAGLFTRNPAVAAAVERRLPVGNLYINRGITGAVVGRQPFGGNRMSGTGAKAGGPDYLLSFMEPRVVSENKMRHGLVV